MVSFPHLVLIGTLLFLGACHTGPVPGQEPPAPASPPMADPDPLPILKDFQTTFTKVNASPLKSPIHGGNYDLYVDKAHAAQYKTMGEAAPEGMTVVKRSLPDGSKIYLMMKVKGYDPAHRDWFYVKAWDGSTLETVGRATPCINCHSAYRKTDYLAVPAMDYGRAILN